MSRVLFHLKIEKKILSGLAPMLFFSTAGHIVFFTAALILSALLPGRAHTNDLEFRVSLSSFPSLSAGRSGGSAAKIMTQKAEAAKPAAPLPAKKKETVKINDGKKKSPNTDKKQSKDKSAADATDAAKAAAGKESQAGSQNAAGDGSAGLTGSITGDPGGISIGGGSDFEFAWYRTTVMSKLKESWMKPVIQFSGSEALQCIIGFNIHKDGSISEILVDTSSGYPALDRSALRAVQDSAPFPPLPYQVAEESLKARFIFELEQE